MSQSDTEITDEEACKLFEEWYRRPTYVNAPTEFQAVEREKLMAVSRAFRRMVNGKPEHLD